MFDRLLNLFKDEPEDESPNIELAAAALLFEIAWADHRIAESELSVITGALTSQFEIDPEKLEVIIEETRAHHDESVGVFPFTRTLNENLLPEQKTRLVETMWMIALIDEGVDQFEEHTIRRIADLLYVPHRDFIAAKLSARDSLKRSDES